MIVTLLLAGLVSFLLTLVLGKFVIAELRKLKAGQEIRKEGPAWPAFPACQAGPSFRPLQYSQVAVAPLSIIYR